MDGCPWGPHSEDVSSPRSLLPRMRQTAPHQVGISADMEVASQTKWLTFQTQGPDSGDVGGTGPGAPPRGSGKRRLF